MRHARLVSSSFFALAVCMGCQSSPRAAREQAAASASAVTEESARRSTSAPEPQDLQPSTRMVIRTARLELRTADLSSVAATLTTLAESLGGYVERSDSSGVGDALSRVDATLRVPAKGFDRALAELRDRGEVLHEGIEGRDVTEQYSDLEAQLRSQEALEERMLAILTKTQTVEEALAVERELVRVRSTIETLEGRRRLLEDQASLATIEVVLHNPVQAEAPRPESVLSRLERALSDAKDAFFEVVGVLIRLFGGLLPVLLVGGPLVYAGRKGLARRRARGRARLHTGEPTSTPTSDPRK